MKKKSLKKIFSYIFGILGILCITLVAGCGKQKDYSISFSNPKLEMYVGDTLDLTESLSAQNMDKEDISIKSLDTSVLTVSNFKITAVSFGTTMVTATYETVSAFIEVKVLQKPTSSDAPTGLKFDKQMNSVTWDKVRINLNGEIRGVSSYTLSIKHNDEEAQEVQVNSNSYDLTLSGTYEIKVKCDPIKQNNREVYLGSDYSQSIVITKLESPTNLNYDDINKKLTWDANEDVARFEVIINGVNYGQTTEREFSIDLGDKSATQVQRYTIQVNSIKDGDNVSKGESGKKTWIRLVAPQISINDGIVSWENTMSGNFHYEIVTKIGDSSTISTKINQTSGNNFDITSLIEPNTYSEISLVAVSDSKSSDSEIYLNSENESKLTEITKLSPIVLSFDQTSNAILFSNYEGKEIILQITYQNKTETITKETSPILEQGKYHWTKKNIGLYTVIAYAKAQTNTQVNSNKSNTLYFNNLASLDLSDVKQWVEDGKYYIEHSDVTGADTYEYTVSYQGEESALLQRNIEDNSFGNVDELFAKVGTYKITIRASKTQDIEKDYVTISSETPISVVRQPNVVISNDETKKLVTWQPPLQNTQTYEYYINKNGELYGTKTTVDNTQYGYSSLDYGNYEIFIKAVGFTSSSQLYLDSLDYASQTFKKDYKLSTPTIKFNRENLTITITKVPLATGYRVTLDDIVVYDSEGEPNESIDLSNKLSQVGSYTLRAIARNNSDERILASDECVLNFVKYSAPTKFSLTKEGVILPIVNSESSMAGLEQTQIKINGVVSTQLSVSESTYNIEAKYVTQSMSIGSTYYLDSDTRTFTIERLQTPQKPELENTILSWEEVGHDDFVYELTFAQGTKLKSIEITEKTIDVETSDELSDIDKTQDYNVSLKYVYNGGTSIDLTSATAYYFTSPASDSVLIHKLENDKNLRVAQDGDKVLVNWDTSEKENVNYELKIKKSNEDEYTTTFTTADLSYDITDYVVDEGVYNIQLQVKGSGYIYSDYMTATVERLTHVSALAIDNDENVIAQTNYSLRYIKLEDGLIVDMNQKKLIQPYIIIQKYIQLARISMTINGGDVNKIDDVYNLSSYDGAFTVKVKLIAKDYTNGGWYYLDSPESEFKFERTYTPSAPTIDNNSIFWESLENTNYKLKLVAKGDTLEENSKYLDFNNTASISTDDESIQSIIKELNTNDINVSVKINIAGFSVNENTTSKLSSYYSDCALFTKLSNVMDITIVTDDNEDQEDLKVSWTFDDSVLSGSTATVKYLVNLYKDNELFAQDLETTEQSITLNQAIESGKYYVTVRVIGSKNFINSGIETSSIVTRLQAPKDIQISQDCILSFVGTENAQRYSIVYSSSVSNGKLTQSKTANIDLQQTFYNTLFNGYSDEISITICAIGGQGKDDLKTVSSPKSAVYTFTKAPKGDVRLFNDYLLAGKDVEDEIDKDSTFIITISTSGGDLLKTLELSYGEKYTYEDFMYQSGVKLDTSIEQQLVIKVVRRVNKDNYILSDSTQKQVTKLASVSNFGAIRKQDTSGDSTLYFMGDFDSNANKYHMTIRNGDSVIIEDDTEFILQSSTFEKVLTLDLLLQLPNSFTITLYKQGMIKDTGISYIDSSKISITVKKLSEITKLQTQSGKLVWNQIADATDYVLRVTDSTKTEYQTGFVNNNVHTLSSSLTGKVGDLSVNIKALGNVTDTLRTQNIILDSTYITGEYVPPTDTSSGEDTTSGENTESTGGDSEGSTTDTQSRETTIVEVDYKCKKLSIPQDFRVTDGYITIKNQDDTENFAVIVAGKEYRLDQIKIDTSSTQDNSSQSYYSQLMYDNLQENTAYEAYSLAISDDNDVIYSDSSSTIKIKVMSNNTKGTIRENLRTISTNPIKYDYTVTEITWDKDTNAQNGYIVEYGGINIYQTSEIFLPNNYDDRVRAGGTYLLRVAVRGTSSQDADGCYCLTSNFGENVRLTKLDDVSISLKNGSISWDAVKGATGYLIYLDDKLYNEQPLNTTSCELEGYSDYSEHKLEICAVSSIATNLCGNKIEYKYKEKTEDTEATEGEETTESEGVSQKISKLQAPETMEVVDGSLTWNITQKFSITELFSLSKNQRIRRQATISIQSLYSDILTLKFVADDSGATYTYKHMLRNFIKLGESVINQFNSLGYGDMLANFSYLGWPTINSSYIEIGADIPSGLYNLYLKQLGDNISYVSSEYGNSRQVYIPYAPSIKMTYTNDSFVLNWDKVVIPSTYGITNPTYVIVVEKPESSEESAKIVRTKLGETQDLSFNLSTCIQDGTLTDEHTKIYVYVKGDNSKVLNGKPSNIIAMDVLGETKAYVKDGEIYWNAQESASEYLITYQKTNETQSKTVTTSTAFWDCDELDSECEYYISIQAIGLRVATSTKATLTGKNTSVGKVIKLATPNAIVNNSVFRWDYNSNATSYQINSYQNDENIGQLSIPNESDSNNYIWYESKYKQANVLYKFKSIGDLNVALSNDTLAYINSSETEGTYGSVLATVQNIIARNGKLTWSIVNNNGLDVLTYKLIFNKIDEDGNIINSDYVVTNAQRDFNDNTRFSYDCADLDSGRYQVTIQAYYIDANNERLYTYDNQTAYYLMSVKNAPYRFEKYSKVQAYSQSQGVIADNVLIHDGKFSWEYSGYMEEVNYNYELVFLNKDTAEEIVVICENGEYFGNIVDEITANGTFTLKVRVVPKEDVVDYISSNYIEFTNINASDSNIIYQLNGIKESDISLKTESDSDSLYINWEKYKVSVQGNFDLSSLSVQYIMEFWTSKDVDTKHTITLDEKKVDTSIEAFDFNIEEGFTLFYRIQVVPLGNASYVPSAFSEIREIQKPETVKLISYDEEKMYYFWSTEGTSTDHSFKIRDEVLEINDDGTLVLDENNQPIVIRRYTFVTTDNTTNTYYPIELGYHRLAVAVTIRTSELEGSLTSNYKYYQNELTGNEIEKIDLFALKDKNNNFVKSLGTSENPYLISSADEFANIKYRLSKPSYENTYILLENDIETRVTLNESDHNFNFKQIANLTGVQPFGVIKAKSETPIFSGTYDGRYNTLTWDCDLSLMVRLTKSIMSLFGDLSASAKICNLKVYVNYQNSLSSSGTITSICAVNRGTIENVILGDSSSKLTVSQRIYWAGVCNQNYGTISKVVNNYSVTITYTVDSSGMGYAGIVRENYGNVVKCANYGNIELSAMNLMAGGIVAINNGKVSECVLKNINSKITIPSVSGTAAVYFGGIVGMTENSASSIEYSYIRTNTTVYRTATNSLGENVYIAGIIGYCKNNDGITSCYVYNTIDSQSSDGIQIGNIYMFAYIVNANRETTYCYYNVGTKDPIGGDKQGFDITSYNATTEKPSGDTLNNGNSYYVSNENKFPDLIWEGEFTKLWTSQSA